jgi:hypothetical protein
MGSSTPEWLGSLVTIPSPSELLLGTELGRAKYRSAAEYANPIDGDLIDRLFREPACRAGTTLEYVGTTPRPPRSEEYIRVGGTWWFGVEADTDPCQVGGHHHVPREVLERLMALSLSGLELDYLRVLHEVPDASWTPGATVPRLVPDPTVHRKVEAALVTGVIAYGRAARAIMESAGRLARLGVSVGAVTLTAPVALLGDPVLLGGRTVAHDTVAWVELARWDWR